MKLLAVFAFLTIPAAAERINLELDPAATRINWTLSDVLHTVHGTFKLKKGDLWYDPATGQAGGLLVVDAASGESGSSARDGRMRKNVLETGRYPEITFVPDHVEDGTQLHGMFTIHGSAHEILMNVKSHIEQQKLTAAISFTVPYVQWGMKDPSNFLLKVKDFVDIDIEAAARVK